MFWAESSMSQIGHTTKATVVGSSPSYTTMVGSREGVWACLLSDSGVERLGVDSERKNVFIAPNRRGTSAISSTSSSKSTSENSSLSRRGVGRVFELDLKANLMLN